MINTIIKTTLKYSLLFSYGGMLYVCIELLFRGRSDVIMLFAGAISFVIIGGLNNFISWNMPLILQSGIGGIIITAIELIFGLIFNQDFSIWNYENLPLNFQGQICLPFTLLWCLLAIIAIILDDYLRYYIFDEEKPIYKIF